MSHVDKLLKKIWASSIITQKILQFKLRKIRKKLRVTFHFKRYGMIMK